MNGMPYHSTGITRHVTSGYLRFHPMLTISLFVVALLSAMLPVVALNSLDLYVQAAKEGAAGQSGGYTYQISGGSNDVAEELRQQVQNGKAIGVKSTQGSVGLTSASGSSRNTIADITFLTGPSRYGTLIEGHQPSQKNEISLSRAAAEQIDAQLGDIVTVQCDDSALSSDYKLIGITVDAANTNTVYATAVSSKDNLQNIQMWLTDDDATVNQGEVAKESATNNVNIGYIKSTIRNAEETVRTRDLPGCQWYGIVLFLCLLCVHIAVMTEFFRAGQCSGDAVVEALVACGFPLTTSRWTVFRGLLICTIPGAAIGIAAGYAVFGLSYRTIGSIFAQYWEWQPSATSLLSIFFVAAILLCSLCLTWLVLFFRMSFKHDITTRNALWYIIPSSAVLLFSCVAIERYHAAAWPFGGSVGSVMGACALGPMLLSLPWLFRTPAQCSAVERTRSLSAPICALALLLLGVSSLFSGQMMIATGNSDNGLFIADYLTQDDLNYLAGKYPETLDKAIVLTAPDESRYLVRAATSHAYDCVTQHGSDDADCYSDSDNETTVMLVDSNSSLAGKTNDVHIAEGGNTGIILIDPTTQKITQAAQVPTEGTDSLLNDYTMPGVVLGIDSPQAKTLGLAPSNRHTLVITDFPSIASGVRDSIRSDIINRCGYAFITEHDTTSYRSYVARAIAMPALATIISGLTFAALAISTRQSQSALRWTLQEFGVSRFQLMRLFRPLGITMSLGSTIAVFLGWLGSHPWIIAPANEFGTTGWWWLIPLPVIFIETALFCWRFSLPERRNQ